MVQISTNVTKLSDMNYDLDTRNNTSPLHTEESCNAVCNYAIIITCHAVTIRNMYVAVQSQLQWGKESGVSIIMFIKFLVYLYYLDRL